MLLARDGATTLHALRGAPRAAYLLHLGVREIRRPGVRGRGVLACRVWSWGGGLRRLPAPTPALAGGGRAAAATAPTMKAATAPTMNQHNHQHHHRRHRPTMKAATATIPIIIIISITSIGRVDSIPPPF